MAQDLVEVTDRGSSLSERISAEARRDRPGGTLLLALVGAPFYLLGWLTFWILLTGGGAVAWCCAAVRLGWMEARGKAVARGVAQNRWPVRQRAARARGSR